MAMAISMAITIAISMPKTLNALNILMV